MNNELKNIFWIDAVKAMCMIGVYWAHTEAYTLGTTPVSIPIIGPFYVNTFFLISGYLLYKKYSTGNNLLINVNRGGVFTGSEKYVV